MLEKKHIILLKSTYIFKVHVNMCMELEKHQDSIFFFEKTEISKDIEKNKIKKFVYLSIS
jgi:hypothetical protein